VIECTASSVETSAVDVFRALSLLLHNDDHRRSRCAFALLDVDGLGRINHEYGIEAGDAQLRWLGCVIGSVLREKEMTARWAGDQFVVLFPGVGRGRGLRRMRRILACLPGQTNGGKHGLAVSAGVAASPADGTTNLDLVAAAAAALREAKNDGGRCARTMRSSTGGFLLRLARRAAFLHPQRTITKSRAGREKRCGAAAAIRAIDYRC